METSRETIVRRSQQLDLLACYLGDSNDQTIPGLFVYGLPSTGKTLAIKTAVRRSGHRLVCVDCVEWHTPRLLYEGILQQVDPNYNNSCCNGNSFIQQLRQHLPTNQSTYILCEKADRLRDMGACVLPLLLKLQELTGCNVGVVLESQLAWEKFREGTSVQEPLLLHMPEYNREDLLEILMLDRPGCLPFSSYHNYISLLLDVSMLACRNLSELRIMASANLAKYIEPIALGEVKATDNVKLWRKVEGQLKTCLVTNSPGLRCALELPVHCKFLLIAAYLASYNPAKLDKRLFVKFSSKKKKSLTESAKKNTRTSNQVLGPKHFPLDRLLAIFCSIIEDDVIHTASIFSQVSSLVSLGLLSASTDSALEGGRYKCLVSLSQVTPVARSVGFEIIKYLYDFL